MSRFVVLLLSTLSLYCTSHAAVLTDVDHIAGLRRFDTGAQLMVASELDVRGVNVGQNAKSVAQQLMDAGGTLHYISGGIRSRNMKVSFYQPYQDSRLEQRLEIDFDKKYGFIEQVKLTWLIDSAYLSIAPVYEKVVAQAMQKYAQPLSMEHLQQSTHSNRESVRLADFLKNLPANPASSQAIKAYFEDMLVTSKTHFRADEQGNALLLTGFKQCYFWQKQQFTEVLSLCSFRPDSGNMKGQGVTLTLRNFAVEKAIENYSLQQDKGIDIQL